MRNEDPEGVKLSSVLNPSCAWILRLVFKKCDFKLYLYIFIYMLVSVFLPVSVFFLTFLHRESRLCMDFTDSFRGKVADF